MLFVEVTCRTRVGEAAELGDCPACPIGIYPVSDSRSPPLLRAAKVPQTDRLKQQKFPVSSLRRREVIFPLCWSASVQISPFYKDTSHTG